jgi:hypothetical protein
MLAPKGTGRASAADAMKTHVLLGVLLPALVITASAHADGKAACLDAATKGQRFRDDHKLVEARDQFRICAAASCPAVLQTDCVSFLTDVERTLPTVVASARSAAGDDLADVKVLVDGVLLLSRLSGQAIAINPGSHVFHFEGADGRTADRQVIVREVEKGQPVAVVLGGEAPVTATPAVSPSPSPSGAAPLATPASPPGEATSNGSGGWMRPTGLVVGGVGVAGLIVGSIFGAVTISKWNSAKQECQQGSCTGSGHDQATSDASGATSAATASTVAFVIGAVAVAAGATLYILAPRDGGQGPSVGIAPSAGPGGAGMLLRGAF